MQNDTMIAAAGKPAGESFLSFTLGGLEYGLDSGKVQEWRMLTSLDRFAADGEIVTGVALSRGVIMPIVDMRAAFGGHGATAGADVIVLKLSSCVMGMVVDGVADVVRIRPDQVTPLSGSDGRVVDYLLGLGVVGRRRLVLVDIDRLMSIGVAQRQVA